MKLDNIITGFGIGMIILLNLAWLFFGGLIMGLAYLLLGVLFCCTVIGLPIGLPLIKLSSFIFWPFGRTSETTNSGGLSILGNIIWLICGGLELAIAHFALGLILCVTLIGIPLGMKHFEIAGIALTPFGRTIESDI